MRWGLLNQILFTKLNYGIHTEPPLFWLYTLLAGQRQPVRGGEQLALVRLGVANVRRVCAALRLATPRKKMPIAANERLSVTYPF